MKKLIIALIIGAVVMGFFDGGDISGALVLGMIFLPGILEKEKNEKVGDQECQKQIKAQ